MIKAVWKTVVISLLVAVALVVTHFSGVGMLYACQMKGYCGHIEQNY